MSDFYVNLVDLFAEVQATIAGYRTANGLPQLTGPDGVGTGTLAIGPEYLDFQLSPPMLIIVPISERFTAAERSGIDDSTYPPGSKLWKSTVMYFEGWCWGDEDPNFAISGNTTYSYDSAMEIRRELSLALVALGGIHAVGNMGGRWEQPANVKRMGRMYVMGFEVQLPILDDPYEFIPWSVNPTTGLQMVATITAISPDGTSTISEGVLIAPPP